MENSTSDMIKQIYGTSVTPVVTVDTNFHILWKNSAAEACDFFNGASIAEKTAFSVGTNSVCINGEHYLFNVIALTAGETGFIVEYIGKDTSHDVAYMKSYFSFLCTRLRDSASQISMAADDIDMLVKQGNQNVAASLNRINRNVMLLLKEAIVPENIIYASECRDESINLAYMLANSAADAENVLGKNTDIWQNAVDDVCAVINANVFEAIVAYMTAQVCGGAFYPEKVEFSVERNKENEERGFVTVRSSCLTGRKNNPFTLECMKQGDFFTDILFKDVLRKKYGISFETDDSENSRECIMRLDVLPKNRIIVRTDKKASLRQERFTDMSAALSERQCAEHYIDIVME